MAKDALIPHPDTYDGPNTGIQKFVFDANMVGKAKRDVEQELDALRTRLDRICRELTLNEAPIIQYIVQVGQDKKELERIGKALPRVGEILERMQFLEDRSKVLEVASDDPGWMASAFGDLSVSDDDTEAFLKSLRED